jgi:hypothetical protein
MGGIWGEPERWAGKVIAAASACDARPGPGYGLKASVRDARLATDTSCILSIIQAPQCSFNLDYRLQVAFQFTHGDFAIGASGRYAGIVVGIGIHRQFIARAVYAPLVRLQLCKQAFAKNLEVALAFALMGLRFGFHRSRFPFWEDGYTVRRPVMK